MQIFGGISFDKQQNDQKIDKKEISFFLIFHRFSPFYCLNNSETVKNGEK